MHSDLHHDSNSELTWISKIKRTNSKIIFAKHVFLLVVSCESYSCVPTEIESRFGFSGKIGVFLSNSGRFDTLLGFLGGTEACSPGKKIEN